MEYKIKQLLVLTFLFVIAHNVNVFAQIDSTSNTKTYRVWIKRIGQPTVPGFLYGTSISSILVQDYHKPFLKSGDPNIVEVDIQTINNIILRKKGKLFKGVLIGTLSGLTIGIATSFILSNTTNNKLYAAMAWVPLTGIGLGIGLAIGGIKISIPINGEKSKFDARKDELEKYSNKMKIR